MASQSTLRDPYKPVKFFLRRCNKLLRSRWRGSPRSVRLLAILALLLSVISSTYVSRNYFKRQKAEKDSERQLLRRNSGLRGKDGSRTIFVPYKDSTAKVVIYPTKPTTFDAHRRLFLNPPRAARVGSGQDAFTQVPPPNVKPGLNLAFLHQFLSLFSIMVPHWDSKESALLVSQAFFLLLRTYLSLLITRLDGAIVRDLVAGNGRGLLFGLAKWCSVGALASYTNATIKFLQSKVSIAFRTRLTRYIHDLYLHPNLNYYKVLNLDGTIGQGLDQYICTDLMLFTNSAAALYSSLGKPLVDTFVFAYQLNRALGPLALTGLFANYALTASFLRRLSPPFGKLKAVEAKREGDFRALHARLIANAEEIAFYNGAGIESVFLEKSFTNLRTWMEGIYRLKIRYNMLEDFILKYSWSAFGYLLTSLPVFFPLLSPLPDTPMPTDSPSLSSQKYSRMESFTTSKRLMLSLADAGSRLIYALKDLSELSGYTSRIYTLLATLHRVHASPGSYLPQQRGGQPVEPYSVADAQGTIHRGYDSIRFESVPLTAPAPIATHSGTPLLSTPLSFSLPTSSSSSISEPPTPHLLLTGPNSSGKSSLTRLLAGLWPPSAGLISLPHHSDILFLPQRPYLPLGTLRDQIIYPLSASHPLCPPDTVLQTALESVGLGYLPGREGGWDTIKEWKDVFSGGEKQRVQFARVAVKKPKWVIADEATSAVSAEGQGLLWEGARRITETRGGGVVVVGTGVSARKWVGWELRLGVVEEEETDDEEPGLEQVPAVDDNNNVEEILSEYDIDDVKAQDLLPTWTFEQLSGTGNEENGKKVSEVVEKESAQIRETLAKAEGWRARKEEIERELKGDVKDG